MARVHREGQVERGHDQRGRVGNARQGVRGPGPRGRRRRVPHRDRGREGAGPSASEVAGEAREPQVRDEPGRVDVRVRHPTAARSARRRQRQGRGLQEAGHVQRDLLGRERGQRVDVPRRWRFERRRRLRRPGPDGRRRRPSARHHREPPAPEALALAVAGPRDRHGGLRRRLVGVVDGGPAIHRREPVAAGTDLRRVAGPVRPRRSREAPADAPDLHLQRGRRLGRPRRRPRGRHAGLRRDHRPVRRRHHVGRHSVVPQEDHLGQAGRRRRHDPRRSLLRCPGSVVPGEGLLGSTGSTARARSRRSPTRRCRSTTSSLRNRSASGSSTTRSTASS